MTSYRWTELWKFSYVTVGPVHFPAETDSVSVPRLSNQSLEWPTFSAAWMSAVVPFFCRPFTFAPFLRSSLSRSSCPPAAASITSVIPLESCIGFVYEKTCQCLIRKILELSFFIYYVSMRNHWNTLIYVSTYLGFSLKYPNNQKLITFRIFPYVLPKNFTTSTY